MSQTLTFDRWVLYGSGFTQSYQAKATISVARSYGSDTARVTVDAQMYSYGGDTNTNWICWVKIGSTWYSWTVSSSSTTHWAGEWYSSSHYWDISVGATSGTLSGQVTFQAYDTGAGVEAYSAYKDWSQSYGSKGASTISSATNVTLNTSGTATSSVAWTAYSNTFTYVLTASYGGASASATYNSLSGNVTKTLTFGTAFINAINTAKSATVTITLTTKSGNTTIGTSTKNITLTVPSGINPTVAISGVAKVAIDGSYFGTKICTLLDKMKTTWSFTASYSSAINSGSVTMDGKAISTTSSPTTTANAVANYGSQTVKVTATDKRGNSGSATTTVGVYYYYYPVISVKYQHNGNDHDLILSGRIASVGAANTTRTLTLAVYKGNTPVSGYESVDLSSYISSVESGGTYDGYYEVSGTYTLPSAAIADIATETYKFVLSLNDVVTTAKGSPSTSTAYSGIAVMTFGAGGTDIKANKPLKFVSYPDAYLDMRMRNANGSVYNLTSADDLNNYDKTGIAWCTQVQNKPSGTTNWGLFMPIKALGSEGDKFQMYFAWLNGVPVPYMRWQTNGGVWYPWSTTKPTDISSSFTYQLSFGSGYVSAYYYPMEQVVRGSFSVYNATTNTFNMSTPFFQIASGYRPTANVTVPMMIEYRANNVNTWMTNYGVIYPSGAFAQNMTSSGHQCYGYFQYSLG